MHVSRTRCFRCGGITRSPANSTLTTVEADLVHRRHAIIETVFADLIDGPLAHMPSGSFGANSAWVLCAAITHNLLCANGILAGGRYGRARGATLRRRIVCWSRRSPGRRSVDRAHEHGPEIEQVLLGRPGGRKASTSDREQYRSRPPFPTAVGPVKLHFSPSCSVCLSGRALRIYLRR